MKKMGSLTALANRLSGTRWACRRRVRAELVWMYSRDNACFATFHERSPDTGRPVPPWPGFRDA